MRAENGSMGGGNRDGDRTEGENSKEINGSE